MQNNMKCCLVRDMLPLYVDGITSEKTNKDIRTHIDGCAKCRELENAMKADVISVEIEGLSDDIDGFKKINNKNKKKMGLSVVMGICMTMFIASFILVNTFIKGKELESRNLQVEQLMVEDNTLSLKIVSKDSACGITGVQVEEKDGVITLNVKGARKSPFSQSTVEVDKEFGNTINKIIVADAVEYEDGCIIDEETRQIYVNKTNNLNNEKKLKNLIRAINVKASYFKTELVEVDIEAGNKVVLEASEFGNMTADNVEFYAKWFSYYMFACIEKLGVIEWRYKIDDNYKIYTLELIDVERLLGVSEMAIFRDSVSSLVDLEYLILEGDIDEENKRYGFEEIEDGYAEGYQFSVTEMVVNDKELVINGEHIFAGYHLGDVEVTEVNGVVNIEAKIVKVEDFHGEGSPLKVNKTFKNSIKSVYLAGDIIYDQGNYITSFASAMYKYKLESVDDVNAVQKLVYGVTVGQRDGYSIYNVDVKDKDIQVKIRINKDLYDNIKIEKATPLILALAKDAESVTWINKNGKQEYKLTVDDVGTTVKDAAESASALQKYIQDNDIESWLSF